MRETVTPAENARPQRNFNGRRRGQMSLFGWVALLIGVVLIVYPVGSFLTLAVWPGLFGAAKGGVGVSELIHALTGYALQSWLNSWWVATGSMIIATSIGTWLSWLTSRHKFGLNPLIGVGVWCIILLPSYFSAIGWQLLVSPGGLFPSAVFAKWILGPLGVVVVLGFKQVALAYIAMVGSWQLLPANLDEAARIFAVRGRTRLRLTLGTLAPGIVAALTLTYANSLQDFGIAATLAAGSNMPLATYSIYQSVATQPINFAAGAAQSCWLLVLLLPAIWLQARVSRTAKRYAGNARSTVPVRTPLVGRVKHANTVLVGAFFGLALAVPIIGAMVTSLQKIPGLGFQGSNWTFSRYLDVFSATAGIWPSVAYSLGLGAIAALAGVGLALVIGGIILRRGLWGRLWDAMLLLVLALPSVVLGAGYIFAFNQRWLPLYGGSSVLVMAYVALSTPYGVRLLLGPLSQTAPAISEAAWVHGLSRIGELWRIKFPLYVWPLLFTFFLLMVEAAFELPATELLYPPNANPIPVAIMAAGTAGQYGLQAAIQIASVAVVAALIFGVYVVAHKMIPAAWRDSGRQSD